MNGRIFRWLIAAGVAASLLAMVSCGKTAHQHTFDAYRGVDDDNHAHTCTTCNAVETRAHDYGAINVIREASLTSDGEITRTCETCQYVMRTILPRTPHEHSYAPDPVSFDEENHAYLCTVVDGCDAPRTEPHTLDVFKQTKPSTLTEEGVMTATCLLCGAKVERPIPVLEPHTVTFRIDGETVATTVIGHGEPIAYPKDQPQPKKDGFSQVQWLEMDRIVTEDLTVDGFFHNSDPTAMDYAVGVPLLMYSGVNDNGGTALNAGNAMIYMLLEEMRAPQSGYLCERTLAHIRNLIAGGNEPYFDCEPYWNYPSVTAALALAKKTPSVWGKLTQTEIERVDCLMRSYAYICAFATDDDNDFYTGPRLRGNYMKDWNPNYRLANVLPILFCVSYFGGGDAVDRTIAEFDYDTVIAEYQKYGFTRALEGWTTEGFLLPDGVTQAPGARELLTSGGWAYLKVPATAAASSKPGDRAGRGVGVRSGGSYTYKGFSLSQINEIFNTLLVYCYSGGVVRSDWYDGETKKAYIMDDTTSVMQGYPGLMLEFNTGGRSSLAYTSEDFLMTVGSMHALRALGLYDIEAEENRTVWRLAYVGNTDTVYKAEHGYYSYASTGVGAYTMEKCAVAFRMWAADWNRLYGDIPAFVESLGLVKKEIPRTTLYFAAGTSTADLTLTYAAAQKTADGKSYTENDFWFSMALRYDESICRFGIRLRAGGARNDLFFIDKKGVSANPELLIPNDGTPGVITLSAGWHYISVRYHLSVEVDENEKTATLVPIFTLYVDGESVGNYRGKTDAFEAMNWWLYRASYDANAEGHVAYTEATGNPYWQLYRSDRFGKGSWFLELMDTSTACGDRAALSVVAVRYELDGGSFEQSDSIDAGTAIGDGIATSYDASPVQHYYSRERTFTLVTPVREGYTFVGWYTAPDETGVAVDPENFDPQGDSVTLYARWEAKQ